MRIEFLRIERHREILQIAQRAPPLSYGPVEAARRVLHRLQIYERHTEGSLAFREGHGNPLGERTTNARSLPWHKATTLIILVLHRTIPRDLCACVIRRWHRKERSQLTVFREAEEFLECLDERVYKEQCFERVQQNFLLP